MTQIFILPHRRTTLIMDGDAILIVATARRTAYLRERWPAALEATALSPAERHVHSWYDAREKRLHLNALSVYDLLLWMLTEGKLRPPHPNRSWRGNFMALESWFDSPSGVGDTIPSMCREATATLMGVRLEGENELSRRQTQAADPAAWFTLSALARASGTVSAPITVEIS